VSLDRRTSPHWPGQSRHALGRRDIGGKATRSPGAGERYHTIPRRPPRLALWLGCTDRTPRSSSGRSAAA